MPQQIPIDLPDYIISNNAPFLFGEGAPPKAADIKQNNPNAQPRQKWFEEQIIKIGKSIGSRQIPWNFTTRNGESRRLDLGAVGHAIANGVLIKPSGDALLDFVELANMPASTLSELGAENRRVWIRAFWGFNPEDGGYLGFTNEGNRDRFIKEYRDGDLVLIYGADQAQTRADQRRQVLGFLEVEPVPIRDVDRSSEAEKLRKKENGWLDRWKYAVPVRRAWRNMRRIEARHIASHTFATHNPVLIASRCELLTAEESKAALDLPVMPADVFGQASLSTELLETQTSLREQFTPSKGVMPTFGSRSFAVEDSENRLYVLKLSGSPAAFLNRQPFDVGGKIVVKIGHAKEPQSRCDAHNSHLPPACAFRWKVAWISRPYSGGEEAKTAEDRLKIEFVARGFESLGGEFFLADETDVQSEFARVSRPGFVISGVPSTP
jgi:hypothetical protein